MSNTLTTTLSSSFLWPGRAFKDSKFAAWSGGLVPGRHHIRLQRGKMPTRADQRRHYIDLPFNDNEVVSVATRYPNGTFFLYDEPDGIGQVAVDEYAGWYARFVSKVRLGSPTARVSPAGFVYPDSIGYINTFANLCHSTNTEVNEWRLHTGFEHSDASYNQWESDVKAAVQWALGHGAPLVLGWGFDHAANDDMTTYLRKAMAFLSQQVSVIEAVYWAYDRNDENHNLVNPNGNLTADGRVFVEMM